MSHFAMTKDEVQICDWTGGVPRVGELMMINGNGPDDYRGKWKATRVLWMARASVVAPAPAYAQVTVQPADRHARAWLKRKRAELAKET